MAPLLPLSCKRLYVGRGDNKVTGSPVERQTLGWSVRRRPCRPVIYLLLLRWRLVWRNYPPTGWVPDNDANTSLWVYCVRSFKCAFLSNDHMKSISLMRKSIFCWGFISNLSPLLINSRISWLYHWICAPLWGDFSVERTPPCTLTLRHLRVKPPPLAPPCLMKPPALSFFFLPWGTRWLPYWQLCTTNWMAAARSRMNSAGSSPSSSS